MTLTAEEIKRFWEAVGYDSVELAYSNNPSVYKGTFREDGSTNVHCDYRVISEVLEAAQWWCKQNKAILVTGYHYFAGEPWMCEIRRITNVVAHQQTLTEAVIRAVLSAEGAGNG